jgi:hypothetical protein
MGEKLKYRLALRAEGNFWNAYWAKESTMDGAHFLGCIAMAAVADETRKRAFMDLMQSFITDMLKFEGMEGVEWKGERSAPEHERSGRA